MKLRKWLVILSVQRLQTDIEEEDYALFKDVTSNTQGRPGRG